MAASAEPRPGPDGLARGFALGAIAAGTLAVLHVTLNGVVPDEVMRWAQILNGAVRYPAGHPHDIFYRTAYSLLGYAAAGLFAIVPQVAWVNAIVNVVYVFMSSFVPFVAALVLTRQIRWACVAMAFALSGSILPFAGRYPVFVFPQFHANGHVGMHMAVLAVALVLGGLWRPAGLVLGLLPGLHAVMAAAVWPWAILYVLFAPLKPTGRDRAAFLRWFVAGLAPCIALGVAIVLQHLPHGVWPYTENPNAALVYRSFTAGADFHRRLLIPGTLAYFVNPMATVVLGLLLLDGTTGNATQTVALRTRIWWLLVFAGMVWVVVYAAHAMQVAGMMPTLLQMTMPNRFSDLTAILLMPLTAAALALGANALGGWRAIVAHLQVIALLAAVIAGLHEGTRNTHYWIAAAWGVTCAWLLLAGRARQALGAFVVLCLALGMVPDGRYGAPAMALGFLVALGVTWVAGRLPEGARKSSGRLLAMGVAAAACVVCLGGLHWLGSEFRDKRWLYLATSDDDRHLKAWLATNSADNELLLPFATLQSALQVKMGHPILFEWETLYLMTYQPAMAGTINMMSSDLYGVDFTHLDPVRAQCRTGGLVSQYCGVWQDAWKARTTGQWQAVGRKYGFRLVLAPTGMPLHLPVAWNGARYNVYTIPPVSPTAIPP